MPREADDFVHAIDEPLPQVGGRIDADVAASADEFRLLRVTLHVFSERIDAIERQAERFADVANRRPAAIGNHRRRQPGTLAAILLIQILQHFLAPLVLEVDVDIWHLVPLAADESLEQQVDRRGIDRRYAQAKTHD